MSIEIKAKHWYRAILIYIYSGVFVFLLGWTKPIISLFSIVCMIVPLKKVWCDFTSKQDKRIVIDIKILLGIIVGIAVLGYCLGWGGFVPQPGDWSKHNAIMTDLVLRDWPVYYYNTHTSMLTYYIGQYMIPAFFGKIVGLFFGGTKAVFGAYVFQYFWSCLGLLFVVIGVFFVVNPQKKWQYGLVFLIVSFFGNFLEFGQKIYGYYNADNVSNSLHWLSENVKIQYSSNYVMLHWVFPQCIVSWLCVLVFLENKKRIDYYIVWFMPLLLYSALPFLGLVIILVCYFLYELCKSSDKKGTILECFSKQNIFTLIGVGTILFFYLLGNFALEKPDVNKLNLMEYNGDILLYVVFLISSVGIYIVSLFTTYKKEVLYWIISIQLLFVYPAFTMGKHNDFTMRASIPALFILMVLVCMYIINSNKCKSLLMIILVVLGMHYPIKECIDYAKLDNIMDLSETWEFDEGTMETFANPEVDIVADEGFKYNYYTYELEDSVFYKYIARIKLEK